MMKTAKCTRHESELINRIRNRASRRLSSASGVRTAASAQARLMQRISQLRTKPTLESLEGIMTQMNQHRRAVPMIASALEDVSTIHAMFSDAGRRFKDKSAEHLAREKLDGEINALAAILQEA